MNDKQKRFCEEYLVDCNATQAAIRAGYSEKSAHVNGTRMLTNASVQQFIASKQAKTSEKLNISAETTVLRFLDIADRAKVADDLGSEIRAMENIGKHLGIFERDNSQKIPQFVLNIGKK